MACRLIHRRCHEQAAVAVEFALVLPVLLLCALGIIEFGRAIWTQTTLNYAVQVAARCYALGHGLAGSACETAAQTQQYAMSNTIGLSPTVDVFAAALPACGAQVSASWQFQFVVPALLPYSLTLTASACYPL